MFILLIFLENNRLTMIDVVKVIIAEIKIVDKCNLNGKSNESPDVEIIK